MKSQEPEGESEHFPESLATWISGFVIGFANQGYSGSTGKWSGSYRFVKESHGETVTAGATGIPLALPLT